MKLKHKEYEYSHSEISDILHIPVSDVRKIEKSALEKIAHYLSELDDFS